jgi:hypothetical protein
MWTIHHRRFQGFCEEGSLWVGILPVCLLSFIDNSLVILGERFPTFCLPLVTYTMREVDLDK